MDHTRISSFHTLLNICIRSCSASLNKVCPGCSCQNTSMFSSSCFLPITWKTCISHQEPSEKHWIPHLPSRLPSPLDCACIPRTHRPTVPVTHVTSPLDYRSGLTRSKARPAIKTRLTSHSLTSQQSPSHPHPPPPSHHIIDQPKPRKTAVAHVHQTLLVDTISSRIKKCPEAKASRLDIPPHRMRAGCEASR
jgi:hypothetical protein